MDTTTLIINYLISNNKNPNIIFIQTNYKIFVQFIINEINMYEINISSMIESKTNLDELLERCNKTYLDFENFINIINRFKNIIIDHRKYIYSSFRCLCLDKNINFTFSNFRVKCVYINDNKLISIEELKEYLIKNGCEYIPVGRNTKLALH